MQMCLERNFGFNYLSWFGAKLTGKRIFDRFWEIADQVGVPRNPYRLGFLQTIAVAETDERAEQEYAKHLEYGVPQGPGRASRRRSWACRAASTSAACRPW